MSDVGLLIPENHRVGVNELLEKLGYKPVEKRFANDLRVTTWQKANVLNLEIHWALTSSDYLFMLILVTGGYVRKLLSLAKPKLLLFAPKIYCYIFASMLHTNTCLN